MARFVSIHEYELRPGGDPAQFEQVLQDAEARGLLRLPGLIAHYFVKGAKGSRIGAYAAVWVYESREAWEQIWGTREDPTTPDKYPENWKVWEEQFLAPFLVQHPDAITFTAYEVLEHITGSQ